MPALGLVRKLAYLKEKTMFTFDATIDAVQTGKRTFVNTFVTNETVKEAMIDFNQTEYTKKAFKATSDMATTVLAESTKAAQNAAKFDYVKFGEGIMKAYNQMQPKAAK
jgi:hypothetical protein